MSDFPVWLTKEGVAKYFDVSPNTADKLYFSHPEFPLPSFNGKWRQNEVESFDLLNRVSLQARKRKRCSKAKGRQGSGVQSPAPIPSRLASC